jgi:hypothetical protein
MVILNDNLNPGFIHVKEIYYRGFTPVRIDLKKPYRFFDHNRAQSRRQRDLGRDSTVRSTLAVSRPQSKRALPRFLNLRSSRTGFRSGGNRLRPRYLPGTFNTLARFG